MCLWYENYLGGNKNFFILIDLVMYHCNFYFLKCIYSILQKPKTINYYFLSSSFNEAEKKFKLALCVTKKYEINSY